MPVEFIGLPNSKLLNVTCFGSSSFHSTKAQSRLDRIIGEARGLLGLDFQSSSSARAQNFWARSTSSPVNDRDRDSVSRPIDRTRLLNDSVN